MAGENPENLTLFQRTLARIFFHPSNGNRTAPAGPSNTTPKPGFSGPSPKSGPAPTRNTQNNQNNQEPNWRFGMFDFSANPSWSLIGCAAPLVLVHAVMERTENTTQGKKVLMWFAYWFLWNLIAGLAFFLALAIDVTFGLVVFLILLAGHCVLGMIYAIQVAQLRIQTRQRYGIAGDEWMDYAASLICRVTELNCDICQMFYEVHSREGIHIV